MQPQLTPGCSRRVPNERTRLKGDLVTDGDRPAGEDVRVQAAPVDEVLDDAGAGEFLQVAAGLADLDAEAFHIADAEPLADQVVQPDAAHHYLAAGLRAGEADVFEGFGLDQRERVARVGVVGEVPVTGQALARDGGHRLDGGERFARADVDLLDVHGPHDPRVRHGAANRFSGHYPSRRWPMAHRRLKSEVKGPSTTLPGMIGA